MTQPTIHDSRMAPVPARRRRLTAAAIIAASAGAAVFAMAVPAAGADVHAREAPRPIGPRLQAILDRAVRAPETNFPGVALYVRRPGHMTWSGAAGKASIEHLESVRSVVRRLAEEADLRNPAAFAHSWHILMKGSIVAAGEGDRDAAKRAQAMARLLIEQHRPSG